jgi:hypothetical protein
MKRAVNSRLLRLEDASEMAADQTHSQLEALQLLADPVRISSESSDDLIAQIREIQACTLRILRRAEATGRTDTALKVMREVRCNMELLARLTGMFDQPQAGVTAVILMPGPNDKREDCVDALIGPEQVVDIEMAR